MYISTRLNCSPAQHEHVYLCMYVCTYVRMCVQYVCMYVRMYIRTYLCTVCMYVCMYICMYVCMYVYMYVCMYVCLCIVYIDWTMYNTCILAVAPSSILIRTCTSTPMHPVVSGTTSSFASNSSLPSSHLLPVVRRFCQLCQCCLWSLSCTHQMTGSVGNLWRAQKLLNG